MDIWVFSQYIFRKCVMFSLPLWTALDLYCAFLLENSVPDQISLAQSVVSVGLAESHIHMFHSVGQGVFSRCFICNCCKYRLWRWEKTFIQSPKKRGLLELWWCIWLYILGEIVGSCSWKGIFVYPCGVNAPTPPPFHCVLGLTWRWMLNWLLMSNYAHMF